jgi:cob(I)alamin adenosyltransferase
MLTQGLVQIYTGDGKGKTTAAVGLAVRAAGQGLRVLFCQFLKPAPLDTGERNVLKSVDGITLHVVDHPWDMASSFNNPKDIERTRQGIHQALDTIGRAARWRQYDLIILDELVFCLAHQLADLSQISNLIERRDEHVEVLLTGRGATQELIELADLVTEMRPIKHPFDTGVTARMGIEY